MIPSLTLFMRGVLETSYTIQAITIALVFSLELGSKTLLLEALHTLLTIHGEVKLILTRKFLSFGKDAIQAADRERLSAVLSSYDHCEIQ